MPSSILYPDELVIDDETINKQSAIADILFNPTFGRGLDLSERTDEGYGSAAERFPRELLVPRSEWEPRIKEMEERKSRISDISLISGLPCKDQGQTNYCWINAPTHCVEIIRVVQNQEMVLLSPASAGGPITSYRNVGGWGKPGLQWIAYKGLVPISRWPANAISRNYATAENIQLALDYRVTEWWELAPRNLDELMSCLFLRKPVALGYNWWRHEVTGCDPVWLDGEIALRIRNSWGMGWGDKGFSVLRGSKMLPDDAVAPRTAIAA